MVRVLFLPLLSIPSGHHHVADVLQKQLEQSEFPISCEKVDILSYSYGKMEHLISSLYLYWIHRFPGFYSSVYQWAAVKERKEEKKRFFTYETLFIKHMSELLKKINPDVIVCTHAFPSYLLTRLKQMNLWDGTVINVYTDYFVNNLWGGREIDYHFVPCVQIKHFLVKRGVDQRRIFVTGIPVDPVFYTSAQYLEKEEKPVVLISGGNMGAGSIREFIMKLQPKGNIHYKVLCGKNEKLYEFVKQLHHPCIEPLPYIASKDKMNRLYEEADAIITKPGGVTISECIAKNLPILVYAALPGQEEQNLRFLRKEKLVYDFRNWAEKENPESDILRILQRIQKNNPFRTDYFRQQIELSDPASFILDLLKTNKAPGASSPGL